MTRSKNLRHEEAATDGSDGKGLGPTPVHLEYESGQKLDAMQRIYNTARDLKEAGLRMQHPDWTEDQIQAALREAFLYART
ncbi:MAG: hypothetical protein IT364_01465 [Candidatus Hydrogenedentes bacterium]|nr:hypothetical protein [Candidatus Hydrogenedentota bacterium]